MAKHAPPGQSGALLPGEEDATEHRRGPPPLQRDGGRPALRRKGAGAGAGVAEELSRASPRLPPGGAGRGALGRVPDSGCAGAGQHRRGLGALRALLVRSLFPLLPSRPSPRLGTSTAPKPGSPKARAFPLHSLLATWDFSRERGKKRETIYAAACAGQTLQGLGKRKLKRWRLVPLFFTQ